MQGTRTRRIVHVFPAAAGPMSSSEGMFTCQWYTRGPVRLTSSSSRRSAAAFSADATTASSARPAAHAGSRLGARLLQEDVYGHRGASCEAVLDANRHRPRLGPARRKPLAGPGLDGAEGWVGP